MEASNISNVISTAGNIASTGNAVSGVAKTANEVGWKEVVKATACIIVTAGVIHLIKKGIDTGFLKPATKIKEDSKVKVIKTQEEEKRKRDEQKHEQEKEIIAAKNEAKKEQIMLKSELEAKANAPTVETIDPTMKSMEEICSEREVNLKMLQLGFFFLERGSTLGICGPTEIGKTTFLIQLLISLAMGREAVSIHPNWNPIKPQKVLLFSTEQSKNDIRFLYGSAKEMSKNLLIETEGMSLETILSKVRYQLDTAGSEGIVVAIDNYTKLSNLYGRKQIQKLDRELTALQTKYQDEKPITLIKVFHTDDNYRAYNPIGEEHIKGSADIANLTKNFIFLSKCRDGENTRILKVKKNKIHIKTDTVSILKYAGTDPRMFLYDREAIEKDVLPFKPVPTKEGEIVEIVASSRRVGRPSLYTDEEILGLNDLHDAGTTWREIEEVYGLKRKSIQNRANKIIAKRARGKK